MQRRIEIRIGDMFENAKLTHGSVTIPEDDDRQLVHEGKTESAWSRERRLLLEAEERGKVIFADILEINPDFRGMFEIPGLIQKQPFVHSKISGGADYLNTDFHGKRNRHGTIYLSALNDRLLMDNNSVFFGHHLETGGMFARLMRYKDAETFKKAPVIILDGLIGEFTYIVFSAHVSEPETWYTSPILFKSDYADYLDELQARSLFITDVDVTPDDRIITLSVCDYTYEDMRFLVHARRLRPGEEVPTEVIAEPNLNRKDFEVSNLQPLGAIRLRNTAVAQNPVNDRMFYYQMQNGMIHRYSGNVAEAQGPFRALMRSGVTSTSFAAAYIRNIRDDDEANRALYLAVEGVGGHSGVINLYSAGLAQGLLRLEGQISPPGVHAKFPALQGAPGNHVWLLYTVQGELDSYIYRVLIQNERVASEPELLYTVQGVTDARPLGYFTTDEKPLIIWHEALNGFIRAARPGERAVYSINDEIGEGARVMLYGDMTGHSLKVAVERGGRMSFININIVELHLAPDALPPEEDDYGDPDGDDGDDGDDPDGNENGTGTDDPTAPPPTDPPTEPATDE
ncbi:MAG: class B sortase [Oscillospiraceae bacterium]|nr:class B sortase [Oscillospiraceae bacterium]